MFDVEKTHLEHLLRRGFEELKKFVEASRNSQGLLTDPLSKCAEACRAAISLAYNFTLAPAEMLLSKVPALEAWTEDEERVEQHGVTAEEPEEYVSVDDIDGQLEYATALGDLMVDLVQTLEQSLSQGGETAFSQLRLSQSEGLHLIDGVG